MIRLFFQWWGRQLWELQPASWRRARGGQALDGLNLRLETARADSPAAVAATRRRGSREIVLGRFSLDAPGLERLRAVVGTARRGAVRLLLPPLLLLEKEVVLPLAAESGLETALRWEMDRLTPFAAEAVFWDWALLARDRARGRLQVRLRLVPKAQVAPALERLAAAGIAPTLLAAAGDPARAVPLDGRHSRSRGSRAVAAAATLCALLALAALAVPLVRQELAFRAVDARIEELRPAVALADGMRRRLNERAASTDVLAAEAGRVGDALRTLASVTQVLPDDTFLFGLTLRDRVLTIVGQSGAAAKLIPAMASDPAFHDPSFAAPVTRNEMTSTEAFTIRAEIK